MTPATPMAALLLALALLTAPPAGLLDGLVRRPAPGAALALDVDLSQRMRFAPMDMPDRAEVIERRLEAGLAGKVADGPQGPARLTLAVDRFDLAVHMGRNEMTPLGAERMDGLALQVLLEPHGPVGPVRLADEGSVDATAYAVTEPLVELLRAALPLALPALPPAGGAGAADGWSAERTAPAALPGIPGLEVRVWSFFYPVGEERCGADRCAVLLEVMLIDLHQQRLLGDSTVRVFLDGAGSAVHRVSLADGLDVESSGRFDLAGRVENHAVPGIPARFGHQDRVETSFRLARRK